MDSWSILPEVPLCSAGTDSDAFLGIGCSSLRSAAKYLYELPYGRNTDRANFRLVLAEHRGTCSTKHALLAAVAIEQSFPLSLTIGMYDMTEANTPGVGRVLASHGLQSIPEAHCYLRYAGRRVDITRSDITPQAATPYIRDEWSIEPSQIGRYKIALHQQYLRDWLHEQPNVSLSFEELWVAREGCIIALGLPNDMISRAQRTEM